MERLGQLEHRDGRLALPPIDGPGGLRVIVNRLHGRTAAALSGAFELDRLAVRRQRQLAQEEVAERALIEDAAWPMLRQAVIGKNFQPDGGDRFAVCLEVEV